MADLFGTHLLGIKLISQNSFARFPRTRSGDLMRVSPGQQEPSSKKRASVLQSTT